MPLALGDVLGGVPITTPGRLEDAQALAAALALVALTDEVLTSAERLSIVGELERRWSIRVERDAVDEVIERVAAAPRRPLIDAILVAAAGWPDDLRRELFDALVETVRSDANLSVAERRFLETFARGLGCECDPADLEVGPEAGEATEVLAQVTLGEGILLSLGRAISADIRLPRAPLDPVQATLTLRQGMLDVESVGEEDLLTFRGKPIPGRVRVPPGEEVSVGRYRLRLEPGSQHVSVLRRGAATTLAAEGVAVAIPFRGAMRTIVRDVSFSVRAGEMVAVIGPSGCGKSSLLSVLNGTAAASAGHAALDGVRVGPGVQAVVRRISFVPQDDLLYAALTVEESVTASARLKGLGRTAVAEMEVLVHEMLERLGLGPAELRESRIGDAVQRGISGGQRKRVSVAQELVGDDTDVLILDEPTSGLDPRNEANVLAMLREIADGGKVVIVTTHAVFNRGLRAFDKVLCLAAGGHFAWFGPAEGVLDHFGAAGIEEVFEKLERWEPARAGGASTGHEADPLRRRHPAVKRALGFWQQLVVLVGRQLKVRVRDPAGVLLALLVPAAVVMALRFIYLRDCVEPSGLFVLSLAALWSGISFTVRDIIADVAVVRHETRTRTTVVSTYASKAIVALLASVLMTALLVVALFTVLDVEDVNRYAGWAGSGTRGILFSVNLMSPGLVFMLLFAAHLVGNAVGLLLSSVFRTAEAAVFTIPLVLVPLIAAGGSLVAPRDLPKDLARVLDVNPLYWTYTGLLASSANVCQPRSREARTAADPRLNVEQMEKMCKDETWRRVTPPEGRHPGSRSTDFVRSVASCARNSYLSAGEFYDRVGMAAVEPKDDAGQPTGDPVRHLQRGRLITAILALIGLGALAHAAAMLRCWRRLRA